MPVASYWPLPAVVVRELPGARAPILGEEDFLALLQNLLPHGRAWPRDPDSTLTKLLRGLALAQSRAHRRALALIEETRPDSAYELLPEWEASLGLPDPCAGDTPTQEQRQAQVLARWHADGGQSVAYLTGVAAKLGFTVEILELSNWTVGESGCDDDLDSPHDAIPFTEWECGVSGVEDPIAEWTGGTAATDWDFALMIRALKEPDFIWAIGDSGVDDPLADFTGSSVTTLVEFAMESACDEPLLAFGNPVLECELARLAPAHVTAIFAYGSP